ncbi:myeloid differentiation primary response protein MyD88 [Tetranychus urticae]|uniref:TIR domain-containing protein n=1 Tax=Tetranychus urticae TaxID=32264 RepID=T1KGQ4_TETUR|nr:myeloid differentiation primary response protein MyD88 [Tetranychus urticae]XP_015786668.1 myeloid differentiation primary response protein MyD88 [Tetranychus urticae]
MEKETIKEGVITTVNLSDIPIRALRIKSRTLLSKCLNAIQIIPAQSGLPRDYRGIADLFGLDNHLVSTIERSADPFKMILENVEKELKICESGSKNPYSINDLIGFLESIERFDVIDDCMELFYQDALFHSNKMKKLSIKGRKHDLLTINDSLGDNDEDIHYDAYVCYADEDIDFVTFLSDYLESPQIGLRLFIRDRDLLLGTMKYDAYTKLIEQRCNYVIIILTPDFVESEECKYQTLFATDLAIQDRERKLIPIILKSCNIPPFVRLMSKIDFSRRDSKWEWVWRKLIFSISSKPMILTSPPSYPCITYSSVPQEKHSTNENSQLHDQLYLHNHSSRHLNHQSPLTAPYKPDSPINETSISTKTLSSNISIKSFPSVPTSSLISKEESRSIDSGHAESISLESSTSLLSTDKPKKNWLRFFKQKLTGLGSSDSSANGYNNLENCDVK